MFDLFVKKPTRKVTKRRKSSNAKKRVSKQSKKVNEPLRMTGIGGFNRKQADVALFLRKCSILFKALKR